MRSLIIGMGIGQLYKNVLTEIGHVITTFDTDVNKNADVTTFEDAILQGPFDTVHICTPNFTHFSIAKKIAPYAKIVFIEKPGLKTTSDWLELILEFPHTQFMLVKNNMWRDNIKELRALSANSKKIEINWINYNRVPNPGTWATTKEYAFGGVSRDLMPHLLSIFMSLFPAYNIANEKFFFTKQIWKLEDLTSTEYGIINPNGIYDVDDYCSFHFEHGNQEWLLTSDWKSMNEDNRGINFYMSDGSVKRIELGLCPEEAYKNMILDAIKNIDNTAFWSVQLAQDLFIHNKIEKL